MERLEHSIIAKSQSGFERPARRSEEIMLTVVRTVAGVALL
jgi:hypothetical protein